MRTGKEKATLVADAISKINKITKKVTDPVEKLEVIRNVCESYKVSARQVMKVADFTFLKTIKTSTDDSK